MDLAPRRAACTLNRYISNAKHAVPIGITCRQR
jgi:hypothetical protein